MYLKCHTFINVFMCQVLFTFAIESYKFKVPFSFYFLKLQYTDLFFFSTYSLLYQKIIMLTITSPLLNSSLVYLFCVGQYFLLDLVRFLLHYLVSSFEISDKILTISYICRYFSINRVATIMEIREIMEKSGHLIILEKSWKTQGIL